MTPTAYIAHLRAVAKEFREEADACGDDSLRRAIWQAKASSYDLIAKEIEHYIDGWLLVPEDESGYEAMFAETNGMAA